MSAFIEKSRLVIIGGGNMGSSFARGALVSGIYSERDVVIIDHREDRSEELSSLLNVTTYRKLSHSIDFLGSLPRLFLVAIKPQDFPAVALEMRGLCRGDDIVLSCMAGVASFQIAGAVNWQRVVRCMPNLPIEVQNGVIGVFYGSLLSVSEKSFLLRLLASLGLVVECETEEKLDAITALSGSGPGYICFLLEKLIETALSLGFDEATATSMIIETVHGTTSLLRSSQFSPSVLRHQVTSHRGTTAAALAVLEEGSISQELHLAIYAAFKRAQELSKAV